MRPALLVLAIACLAPAANSQPQGNPKTYAQWAELRARDTETAAAIASSGQLLYDAEANKKSWGQYCASAQTLAERGEFRAAIREASKALFLGESTRNPAARAYSMRDLAYAYSLAGDLDRAEEWARKALPAAKAISNPNVNVGNEIAAPVHKVLGDIASRRGDHDEAMRQFAAALDAASMFSNQKVGIRLSMAAVELRRKQPARAREILAKEATGSDVLAGIARRGLADAALLEGKNAEAIAQFTRAAEAARTANSQYAEMWAHFGLARAHRAAQDKIAAATSLDRAVALAESLRGAFRVEEFKSGFFGEVQEMFDFGVDLAAESGDSTRALEISEKSRARAALDMLRGRTRKGGRASLAIASGKPMEIAATLPERTALVVYHVLADRTVAWTMRRDATQMKSLPAGANELARTIGRLRAAIADLSAGAKTQAQALHRTLIAPLDLRGGETVVFVPHRALHLAPLHALADERGPVIAAHPVAYALSVSAAGESLGQPLASTAGLVALGNPDLGDPNMDLPAAEEEVRAIAKLSGGVAPFVRKEASASRFRAAAPGAGIVHVAAHATVDDVDPLFSTLKLAAGDIEAGEIYDMDLGSARLVTLSACSSGLGRVAGGDEFFGFKRSFLVAGAKSLLVSLWPVADESTARLMEAFYRHRREKPAAEALQRAQVEMLARKDDAEPLYWAPFVLVGDWR